ncbi:MAG: U32 family peptidase [Clostridia bacterium]|nr:U32 family peptidase [Clostridia bacterium]
MAEILAPAGSMESVFAAVRSGADAVYLAGENFNARRNAENFTAAQLEESVAYCHAHGVKVYHALNTLVKDSEIGKLIKEIERILTLREDALILQDLGVAALVKAMAPDMPLHASTQLSAHSLAGVQALEKAGFRRVVLARELSRAEIEHIRRHSDVELEVFVHGALCMCVSGQCLMSAFFGARSGNRGLCAQPCRLPFRAPGGTGHDLSLKDNSLLPYLPEMAQAGVDSFKIEGRMKRPEYVAASVNACREALAGSYLPETQQQLKRIFSRQGFTDGYYTASRGKAMFGARTKEDVTAADAKLLGSYAALYAKETPRVPCEIACTITADAYPTVCMRALGKSAAVSASKMPEPALHRALTKEDVADRLQKLGGTGYFATRVTVDLQEGLMLSAGEINALRRKAVAALQQTLSAPKHYQKGDIPALPPARRCGNKQLYLRFANLTQVPPGIHYDKIILPIEQAQEAVEAFGTEALILETPRVFFGLEKKLIALLEKAKALGITTVAVGNIGALQLAKEKGFRVLASLGMNVFNSYACEAIEAEELVLSPEMSTPQINSLHSQKPFGAIVYGHLPLMISRNCPLRTGRSCQSCDKQGFLTDRKGEQFPVRCRFGASEIFNPHALYMLDKEDDIHSDFSLLYFTTQTPAQVQHVLTLYQQKAPADFAFTRGLYQKGVL